MQSIIRFTHNTLRKSIPVLHLSSKTYSASTKSEADQLNIPSKKELTDEEMEKMKNNPYFDKYAKKLQELENKSPEDFQKKVDTLLNVKVDDEIKGIKAAEEMRIKMNEASSQTKAKKLDSVMKTELLDGKSEEQISDIWRQHHQSKKSVFAVIPANEYEIMHKKLSEFPCFIYPVARGTGYEFYLQQFANNTLHFTPLSIYKLKQEASPNCLSLIHYTELIASKGLVLMHGEPDTSLVSMQEAQLLALQVKMYYGIQSGLKFNLVRQFNVTPESFRHMDLVKEFEYFKKDINTAHNLEY